MSQWFICASPLNLGHVSIMNIICVANYSNTIGEKLQKGSGLVMIVCLFFGSIIQIGTLMRADHSWLDKNGNCKNKIGGFKTYERCCGGVGQQRRVTKQFSFQRNFHKSLTCDSKEWYTQVVGCRKPDEPLRAPPIEPQFDEPPSERTPSEGACRVRKRQIPFDSSIDDPPSENPLTDAYDRVDEPENPSIDTGNNFNLVALEGAQDGKYDSDKMIAINNEDC